MGSFLWYRPGLCQCRFRIGPKSPSPCQTSLERNGDVVRLASYAPLFANNNSLNWNPNAIHFDSGNVFGTPSYWVQRLFMGR